MERERGSGCGRGGARRRSLMRSGPGGRESRGEGRHGRRVRGYGASAWRLPETSGQAGREEVAGRVRARRGHTPSCLLARG